MHHRNVSMEGGDESNWRTADLIPSFVLQKSNRHISIMYLRHFCVRACVGALVKEGERKGESADTISSQRIKEVYSAQVVPPQSQKIKTITKWRTKVCGSFFSSRLVVVVDCDITKTKQSATAGL